MTVLLVLLDLAMRSATGHALAPRDGSLDGRLWTAVLACVVVDAVLAWRLARTA